MLSFFIQTKDKKVENQIQDIKDAKENFLDDLTTKEYIKIYETSLSIILSKTDVFFGKKLLSFKSFRKHFMLSLTYSFVLFLFFYVITGANQISRLEIMPKEENLLIRISFLMSALFFMSIILAYMAKRESIIKYALSRLNGYYGLTNLFLEILLGIFLLVAIIGTFVLIGQPAYIIFVIAMLLSFIVSLEGLALLFFLTIFLGGSLLDQDLRGVAITLLYALFLPFINACFDFTSTSISRLLAEKLLFHIKERNHLILWSIVYFFIDIFFALVTFVLLSVCIYFCFELVNFIVINMGAIEDVLIPEDIIQSLMKKPFGEYIWITIMIVSTLVPTIIHFIIACFSALSLFFFEKPNQNIIYLVEGGRIREGAEEYINLKFKKTILWFALSIGIIYICMSFLGVGVDNFIKALLLINSMFH